MHLSIGLLAGLRQTFQELLLVFIVLEDWLAAIPAVYHVINRPGYWMRNFRATRPRLSPVLLGRQQYSNTIN
jgi:hypothetical protein